MKTFSPTPADIDRQWYLVDAEDQILGRLAAQIAHRLRGKHKPEFAPHMDNGDFIVVINCEKIRVTGTKMQDKFYYSHSGWVGGLKEVSLEKLLASKPEEVLRKARSEEHTSELQSRLHLVCRLLLEKNFFF